MIYKTYERLQCIGACFFVAYIWAWEAASFSRVYPGDTVHPVAEAPRPVVGLAFIAANKGS